MPVRQTLSGIPKKVDANLSPNIDSLVIDDGTPVDGIYSEKQMRLLTEPLYSSWDGPGKKRTFLALANVGLFFSVEAPPIVPDVMLSVDVKAKQLGEKKHNTYFLWEFGKQPEVAIEIVSNRRGGEFGEKRAIYARIGVPYYIVWDPENLLKKGTLHAFVLRAKQYEDNGLWFPEVNMGIDKWEGEFEGIEDQWIRWTDAKGRLIPTGAESSKRQRKRAKQATELAKQADERATQAEARAAKLKAKLRELGADPDAV